jgi:cation-transporting P-type ATPase E
MYRAGEDCVSLQPSHHPGLTSAEVADRVRRGETNNFKPRVGRTYWHIFRDNILNVFNIVFFVLMVVVLWLQDYSTAIFAGFSVVTNSILGMFQEITAKRQLDKLAALAAKDILVWRDGKLVGVPLLQLVKDDIIPIEPGDRLVVDGRVLVSDSLEMDESQLTGESDAVFKDEGAEVHSGSFCIAGTGLMIATKVGKDSTVNNLSTIAKTYKNILTPTQKRLAAMVNVTLIIMLIVLPMLFLQTYLNVPTLLEIVRSLVVFVSSIVPQGLVLTAILSLTIGAVAISRFQTLIQRVNAVESLANVTVLCFDKTGTLTRNQLKVQEIIPLNGHSLTELQHEMQLYTANLAHRNRTAGALLEFLPSPSPNGLSPVKLREIPFNSSRKWGAVVFQESTLVLGAPERVLNPSVDEKAIEQSATLAAQGLRVLAFARAPVELTGTHLEGVTQAQALIVYNDQIRPDIQDTLNAFREQNVALKVISGDNLETVKSIALASGIEVRQAYTGDELDRMSEPELENAAMQGDLFARIEPDTKRKIVAALKRQGHYVAMVGDGVNDVPALKEAQLAIAMNDGAQISKDVAEIVLLNNAMSTLPKAFAEGRIITQTIFGTTRLFLIKNFYVIALIFFIGFMALPFPIMPIQISWMTLGTVNIPATLIAFKIIRPKIMKEFRRDVIDHILIAGMVTAVNLALLFTLTYYDSGQDVMAARTAVTVFIAFVGTVAFWNLQGIELFEPRSLLREWRIVLMGIVLCALTIFVPFLFPEAFMVVVPSPLVLGFMAVLFLLNATVIYVLTKNRYLINQLWEVLKP